MALIRRRGTPDKLYCYRSFWSGGRWSSRYLGSGPAALAAEEKLRAERTERAERRAAWERELQRWNDLNQGVRVYNKQTSNLFKLLMVASGHYSHKRTWRRDPMHETALQAQCPKSPPGANEPPKPALPRQLLLELRANLMFHLHTSHSMDFDKQLAAARKEIAQLSHVERADLIEQAVREAHLDSPSVLVKTLLRGIYGDDARAIAIHEAHLDEVREELEDHDPAPEIRALAWRVVITQLQADRASMLYESMVNAGGAYSMSIGMPSKAIENARRGMLAANRMYHDALRELRRAKSEAQPRLYPERFGGRLAGVN